MDDFRRMLERCSLTDLGWVGNKYIWCKGNEYGSVIRERCDRAMANHVWSSKFSIVKVEVLVAVCSDHSPLLLNFNNGNERMGYRRGRLFMYDISWDLMEGCKELLQTD